MAVRVFAWSDLHLEHLGAGSVALFRKLEFARDEPGVAARVLVAAGDIAPLSKPRMFEAFVRNASSAFDHVVVVPGNHEYYGSVFAEAEARMVEICGRWVNVHLLNGASADICGVRFIGATLWSHLSRRDARRYTTRNKFYEIYDQSGRLILPAFTNALHAEHVAVIERELAGASVAGTPAVVCTHHAPLFSKPEIGLLTSRAEFLHSPNNAMFHSDQGALFRRHGPEGSRALRAWVYGHTHYRASDTYRGVALFTNQLGYPGELGASLAEFDRYAHIDVAPCAWRAPHLYKKRVPFEENENRST